MSTDERYRAEPLRFRHLKEAERRAVCNGCGGKGGIVPIPDFFFTASCDHHDFNYWQGCKEADRERADREFYLAMKRDVRARLAWWRRWWGYVLAFAYYRAVRRFGRAFFHYAARPRGWGALDREMGRACPECKGHGYTYGAGLDDKVRCEMCNQQGDADG